MFALEVRWGVTGLLLSLAGLALCASCTSSEDTEPFVPAVEGARQPGGSGALLSEDEACERVREAAEAAYGRLRCEAPSFVECPAYVRPGGASGCFEYFEDSVRACEKAYESAATCGGIAPCVVSAQRNDELATCELAELGAGGQGGGSAVGGAGGASGNAEGGAGPQPLGGAPGASGAAGAEAFGGVGGAG